MTQLKLARSSAPSAQWETITPAIAAKLLESNTHNRVLSQARIEAMESELRAGNWNGENGETIKIGSDGVIIDGQHRLWAIFNSGITVKCLVVRNLSPDAFKTVDIGKQRTTGDIIGIAGVSNANNISAATSMVFAYRKKKLTVDSHGSSSAKYFRRSDLIEFSIAHKDDLLASYHAAWSGGTTKLTGPGPIIGLHYLFVQSSKLENRKAMADAFYKQLGEGLFDDKFTPERHPIRVLREKLLANRASISRMPTGMVVALMIKAWNSYALGKSVSALRMISGEQYPVIA